MSSESRQLLPAEPDDATVARWRAQTAGCQERIHLNNAGAALSPDCVVEAMCNHLQRERQIGGYEAADEVQLLIEACYSDLAQLIGAAAHNIAIVENATVAVSQALSAFDFRPGDRIVTSRLDYPSNQLMYLSLAQRQGVELVRADDLPEGGVDPASVARLADHPRCRLVSLTWVPTNAGTLQQAQAVGAICASLRIPYLLDACQVVGQLPIDVNALQCDFLAATGRKFLRGPRGIGFLYVSDRMLDRGVFPLYVDMLGADWIGAGTFRLARDARRFENWEFAYALVLGLAAAAKYAKGAGASAMQRTQRLANVLRSRLRSLEGIRLMDRGRDLSAIVTVSVAGHEADDLVRRLRQRCVNSSAASRESGVLDMDDKGCTSLLRLSPHYYNTETEIEQAAAVLADLRVSTS